MLIAGCCCIKEELPCRNWSTCDKEYIYLEITVGKSKTQDFEEDFRKINVNPQEDCAQTDVNRIIKNTQVLNFSMIARFGIYLKKQIYQPDSKVVYELPWYEFLGFGQDAITEGYLVPYNFSVSGSREEESTTGSFDFPCDAEDLKVFESTNWDVEAVDQDGESPLNYSIANLRFEVEEKRGTGIPCFNQNETCYLRLNIQGLGLRYLYDGNRSGYYNNCDFNCNCTPDGIYNDDFNGGGTVGFSGTADWVIGTDNTIDDCEDLLDILNRTPLQDTFAFIGNQGGTGNYPFFVGDGGTDCTFNASACVNNPSDIGGLNLPNNCNNGQYVGALELGTKRVECNRNEFNDQCSFQGTQTTDIHNCTMSGTFDFLVTAVIPSDGPEQQP